MGKYKFEVTKKMNKKVIEKRTSVFDTNNILAGGLSPELYHIPQKVFDKIETKNKITYKYSVETTINVEKLI